MATDFDNRVLPPDPKGEQFFATCVGTDGVERTIMITREEHDELLRRGATMIATTPGGDV